MTLLSRRSTAPRATSTARRLAPAALVCTAVIAASATTGAFAATLITGAQIADETITTKDVKNGSLSGADLGRASIFGAQINGATKKTFIGVNGYEVVEELVSVGALESDAYGEVYCPEGTAALSGAAYWSTSDEAVQFLVNPDGSSVSAYASNPSDVADDLVVQAVCATVN
ncbi:hypothetical protein INN71_12980 [Nocardioides sp. ChNu-153]|uniref:hypothetical protein n=1 Tax=unclassified Nocardioides TaxID=2615069 RepID=UPI0024063118|nr:MULTISPECIES: hypothetical protein [unclassified Nocardioides]MDF9715034.1 hypothetical protein [Nocardioides sp. ChNu-99]MDN7122303.1 hypothetical protein [Nocardioides sp. ChNu-153]